MSYDIRDDMLQCFCNSTNIPHYYNTFSKKIIYFPNISINPLKARCKFFFNDSLKNNCNNKDCSFKHIKSHEIPLYKIFNPAIYKNHILENGILGWKTTKSYDERTDRRIKTELPNYLIHEKNNSNITIKTVVPNLSIQNFRPNFLINEQNNLGQEYSPSAPMILESKYLISKKKRISENIEYQPRLSIESEWFETKTKKLKFNGDGLIFYVNKNSGNKSWIHPNTGKTNLPGGYNSPSEAGLT